VDGAVTDRRVGARLSGLSLPIAHATLRPGTAVHIVDLSQAGILIQSDRPLRPGGRTQLRVEMTGRTLALPASVLRCFVWSIHPMGGVSYRAALRFDGCCPAFWEEVALSNPDSLEPLGA